MSKTEHNFKHTIKYLKILSEEDLIKALDRLLEMKLIGKKEYKVILKECLNQKN